MMRPRVLIADDHPVMLQTLIALLSEDCEVVGQASDGKAAIEAARRLKPDVLILDISMPVLGGFDAAREIRVDLPQVRIVFVTAHDDPALAQEAFRLGASAFVLKHSADATLLATVQKAFREPRILKR
jgi:DNA-binding NarL/FixJ family response regulator